MRPLIEMASLAGSLNANDLTPRLEERGPNDEISQLAASFNDMLDRLQSAFRELEQFNAFVSHELRNALAVVRTHLEVGLAAPTTKRRYATPWRRPSASPGSSMICWPSPLPAAYRGILPRMPAISARRTSFFS